MLFWLCRFSLCDLGLLTDSSIGQESSLIHVVNWLLLWLTESGWGNSRPESLLCSSCTVVLLNCAVRNSTKHGYHLESVNCGVTWCHVPWIWPSWIVNCWNELVVWSKRFNAFRLCSGNIVWSRTWCFDQVTWILEFSALVFVQTLVVNVSNGVC